MPRLAPGAVLVMLLAVPAWADLTVEDFLRSANVRDAELSPDGSHLAMVLDQDGKRSVIVRNIQDPEMPIVGAYTDDIIRPNYLYWGNDDRLLVALTVPSDANRVRRDKERKPDFDIDDYFMFSRMVALNRDMSDMVLLMEDQRRLRSNVSLSRITNFLPNDDDNVLMVAFRNGRRVQYRVNIDTGESEQVTIGSTRTYRFLNDTNGVPRYRFDYHRRSRAIYLFEYADNGRWKRLEKLYINEDDEDSIDTRGLIGLYDDSLVYRKQNEETGYYELLISDRGSDKRRPLVSLPDRDIRGVLFDFRADQIVGYTTEEDYVRHSYFDEVRQAEYDAIAEQVGPYNFDISSFSQESQVALVRSWGADDPLSYHLWDLDEQKLTFLAHAYKDLATANLSIPAVTTYRARDGQPIRAYLLLPRDYEKGKTYPTVVLPHGGPHARSRASYDDFAQFMSTRGYVVIQPNFRGSVGYGRDFEEAGYKEWGGLMQDDVTDAVNFLVGAGLTDPDNVCIVGGSYGGYAALMGAIKTPSLFQCAVSLNGVTHLAKMVEYDMKEIVDKEDWQTVLFDRIGHPDHDRELLDENSPALHADKISIPVLLVAGTDDQTVPFSQAKLMEKALKKAGADYVFIRLEDAGHNVFMYREDKETVFEAVEAFLRANIQ